MESGEWRYGQDDDGRPWPGESVSPASPPWPARSSLPTGQPGPAPDLWGEDTAQPVDPSFSWLPSQWGEQPPAPVSGQPGQWGDTPSPVSGQPPQWGEVPPPVSGQPWDDRSAGPVSGQPDPWHQVPAATGWGQPVDWEQTRRTPDPGGHGSARGFEPPAPALRPLPTIGQTSGVPNSPVSGPSWAAVGQVSPAGPTRRTGVDNWSRPLPATRGPVDQEEDDLQPRRRRDTTYGDEPAYGPVLGFTAGWYAIPAVLYLVWLITLDSDRQSLIGRQFVASLPWLVGAVVMSLAVAGLLRWATVGWRTLTLSFAAAVIGAGVATIAHSLVL